MERALANAGRATLPEPLPVDTGAIQGDDAEAERLLAEQLGAHVVEDWRRTADGSWRDRITGRTTNNP